MVCTKQALVAEQEIVTLVSKEATDRVSPLKRVSGFYICRLHCSMERGGIASDSRSLQTKSFCQNAHNQEVVDVETGCDSNQIS